LFAPTIFINGAVWGQCDAIYTAFCLGSLYFLLKERPAWACAFFAIAFSFKLQAIFFLPVLLVILLKKKMALRYLIFIPVIFLLSLAPAFIAGRDAVSLLSIYEGQVTTGGVGGGGQFNGFGGAGPARGNGNGAGQTNVPGANEAGARPANGFEARGNGNDGGARQANRPGGRGNFNGGGVRGGNSSGSSLTLNAPTFYQWFPANTSAYWKWIGVLLAGIIVAVVGVLILMSKESLTLAVQLKIALVFVLVIPFLLPDMHERYFYLADVISIAYAFYFPRAFYIAVVMQLCSLVSYAPYLLGHEVVSLKLVAGAVLVIALISLADLVLALYPNIRKRVGKQVQVKP
jgi:Gpi18-like mannosyltransferase